METIFYFLGLIFAIFIAIYFIDTVHSAQESSFFKGKMENGSPPETIPVKNSIRPKYSFPRPKICPLCHAELEAHDVLVATIFDEINERGKQRVLIHGCKYCSKQPAKNSNMKVVDI